MFEGFDANTVRYPYANVPKYLQDTKLKPHMNANPIQSMYLSGSLYKNHPCYSTFQNYNNLPIKDGYQHTKRGNQIVVGGVLDNPLDPRFNCLRTTRQPLSSGHLSLVRYKFQPLSVYGEDLDTQIMRDLSEQTDNLLQNSLSYGSRSNHLQNNLKHNKNIFPNNMMFNYNSKDNSNNKSKMDKNKKLSKEPFSTSSNANSDYFPSQQQNSVYRFRYEGDRNKYCMYTTEGTYVCMDHNCS